MTKKKKPTTRTITRTRRQVLADADRISKRGERLLKRGKVLRGRAERMPPGHHWNPRTSKVVSAPVVVEMRRHEPTLAELRRWARSGRKDVERLEAQAARLEANKKK